MASYSSFRESAQGRRIIDLVLDPEVVTEMESLSHDGRPAVMALDAKLASEFGTLDAVTRQHVGRVVRDVLTPRGFRVATKRRLRAGRVFVSGAVFSPYRPSRWSANTSPYEVREAAAGWIAPAASPTKRSPVESPGRASVAERLARARAILEVDRGDLGTVDEFLAARRAMWGRD